MEDNIQELEFLKELVKRKDEELQELKEKLTQRDKVISFLICDTRQSRFMDVQEAGDNVGSSNTKENKPNKFGFPVKEIRYLGEIIDKIEEMKVHQNNSNKSIEEMTQDVINNINSLKIKLDDDTRKTDEINKAVLNIKINIEGMNFKIGHSDQKMKELKNELIAQNELLTRPSADVDNGKNTLRQLSEKVDNNEKNVSKLLTMFENANMIVSSLDGTKKEMIEQTIEMKNIGKISQELEGINQEVNDTKTEVCRLNKEVANLSTFVHEVNSNYECMVQRVQENKNEIETRRGLHELEKKELSEYINGTADSNTVLHELEEKVKQKLCEIEDLELEIVLLKEHESIQDRKMYGLDCEITNALKNEDWRKCVDIIEKCTSEHDIVYKQLRNVELDKYLPLAAAEKGYVELIQVLLYNGLNVNEKMASTKKTMLHMAAEHGKNNVVELLLFKSADIEVRDFWEKTPLHIAAVSGHVSTVQLLIEEGANINSRNKKDCTALHFAAYYGHTSVVQCLLDNNCNREIKTCTGISALCIAREKGYSNIVRLLDK